MFEFSSTADFIESLKSLDSSIQKQIKEKLAYLSKTENPLFFAKKLKGYKNLFRFRSGDHRMVFRLEKNAIVLLTVKHRKEIYEGL